jgi:micrococcal nuclease
MKPHFSREISRIFLYLFLIIISGGMLKAAKIDRSLQKDKHLSEEFSWGIVLAVYDGDTIKVELADGPQEKVRLLGIDCQEMNDPDPDLALMAFISKRVAFISLYRKTVKLAYDWERRDKYGRLLAYVWTEEFGLFNKHLLDQGLAVVFQKYPFKHRDLFLEAEKKAQESKLGFWQDDPWPIISSADAEQHTNCLVSVRFCCDRIRENKKFVFLESQSGGFSAVFPQKMRGAFSDIESWQGTELMITGFIEDYKGQPQIMVEVSSQIKVPERPEVPCLIPLLYTDCLGIIRP